MGPFETKCGIACKMANLSMRLDLFADYSNPIILHGYHFPSSALFLDRVPGHTRRGKNPRDVEDRMPVWMGGFLKEQQTNGQTQ